jgi:uncharacterized oligopeptide transporter (OPT) family protein
MLSAISASCRPLGVQLIVQLGVTPNTSIIGALVAMVLARVPLALFARYRSIMCRTWHRARSRPRPSVTRTASCCRSGFRSCSAEPISPCRCWRVRPYRCCSMRSCSTVCSTAGCSPPQGTWPPGITAAEAIRAGDSGGKRAALLALGLLVGLAGSWLKITMSAFGVAFIGNVWALAMFGIGFLVRGYATPVAGIDMAKMYVPRGFMVAAGIVALVQMGLLIARRGTGDAIARAADDTQMQRVLGAGSARYVAIAVLIALLGGLVGELSPGMLVAFCPLRRLCRLCA